MLIKRNLVSIIIAITVFSNFTLYGCQRIFKTAKKEALEETVEVGIKKTAKKGVEETIESRAKVRRVTYSKSLNKIILKKNVRKYNINFSGQSKSVFLDQEEFREFVAREKKFKDVTGKSYIKYKQELTEKIITETEVIPDESQAAYKYLTEKISRDLPQKLKFEDDIRLNKKLYEEFEKYYFYKLSTNIYQKLNDTLSKKIGNQVPKTLMNASLKLAADEVAHEFLIASFISNSLDARIIKLINETDRLASQNILLLKDERRAVNKSFSSFINKELTEDLTKYLNKELTKKGDLWSSRGYKVRQVILLGTATAVSIQVIDYLRHDSRKDDLNLNE